jgi:hypothetical protein
MDDLAYLSTLDERSFEAERCRIIASAILKAPPNARKPLVRLQMELDQLRDKLTPEQFMAECMRRSTESLENLADQFGLLKSAIVPPPIKSPAER